MNSEKKRYLSGLVYGQLPEERLLTGFIKYYVLEGQSLVHLQSDIALISWPVAAGETAKKVVKELEKFAEQGYPVLRLSPGEGMPFAEMLSVCPS